MQQNNAPAQIRPSLGLFDVLMVVVSLIIGSGIFRSAKGVAAATGEPSYFALAWLLGGAAAILGGLTYAEIGARRPVAGGFYSIVAEAFGPLVAFVVNILTMISTCASSAAVAAIGCDYIVPLLPFHFSLDPVTDKRIFAALFIGIIYVINLAGIRLGSTFQNVISGIKILMIVAFGVMALLSEAQPPQTGCPQVSGSPVSIIGAGLVMVFFTFGGYQHTINLGNDVRNPRRNMPLGIVGGVLIVLCLYLLVNYCYYKTLGMEAISTATVVAADSANVIFGSIGSKIVSVAIFISAAGFLNATFIQTPRVYYSMAENGVLPRVFMRINSRTQAQGFGLTFLFVVSVLFVFGSGAFEQIVNYIMFYDTLILGTVGSTIFMLRYRMRGERFDGFRLPLFPLIPAVYILFLAYVFIYSIAGMESGIEVLYTSLVLVVSVPLYYLVRWLNGSSASR